ncbi:hypothetical protein ABEW05_006258 [Botrytis cinerea]
MAPTIQIQVEDAPNTLQNVLKKNMLSREHYQTLWVDLNNTQFFQLFGAGKE